MFAPFCYPPASAESIVTAKLLLAFLDAGWEIDVIAQADSGQFYPYDITGIWKPIAEITKNIDVSKGFRMFEKLPNSKLKRALSKTQSLIWVAKAVYAARRLSAKKKYDFMLSRVSPQYGHLPALLISKELNIPWIANWSDPMPPQKSPYPYGNGPNARLSIFLQKYFDSVARKASWHTFPSERLHNYICSYLPECREKSSVIPHPALTRLRSTTIPNRKEFLLCHIGGLGLRKPDIFLEGVSKFLNNSKISFPFFIKFVSREFDNVKELAKKFGLEDVIILEKAKTYEETQKIAENSTALIVIEADLKEGIFFPSKFVDLVQTGRPILAVSPVVGTLSDIISEYGGGMAINVKSPDAVAKAIEEFYTEWKKGKLDEQYSSDRLFHLFGEKLILNEYSKIFKKLKSI